MDILSLHTGLVSGGHQSSVTWDPLQPPSENICAGERLETWALTQLAGNMSAIDK